VQTGRRECWLRRLRKEDLARGIPRQFARKTGRKEASDVTGLLEGGHDAWWAPVLSAASMAVTGVAP